MSYFLLLSTTCFTHTKFIKPPRSIEIELLCRNIAIALKSIECELCYDKKILWSNLSACGSITIKYLCIISSLLINRTLRLKNDVIFSRIFSHFPYYFFLFKKTWKKRVLSQLIHKNQRDMRVHEWIASYESERRKKIVWWRSYSCVCITITKLIVHQQSRSIFFLKVKFNFFSLDFL